MSTERDSERLLRQWLDEGPTRAADRLVETVEERIDRQRQRPAWRFTWRDIFMNRTIGSFAAGAAVVAVALLGYNVLAGQGKDGGGIGAPAPSAPVAITPSPTVAPPSEAPPAADGLTVSFSAHPEGWDLENPTTLVNGQGAGVEVFEDRSVMSAYPDCVYGPAQGVGKTASDIASALSTRAGVDASGPQPVEVGGLSGQVFDIAVADGFTDTCEWWEEPGTPMVPTVGAFDDKNNWLFVGVIGEDQERLYVLDRADGGNIVIEAWATDGDAWAANEADLMSIVGGIQFEAGS